MDSFNGPEDLVSETQGGGQGEGASGLRSTQLRKVLRLQLHHHIVESLVPAAPDEATHMVSTLRRGKMLLGCWGARDVIEWAHKEVSPSPHDRDNEILARGSLLPGLGTRTGVSIAAKLMAGSTKTNQP